MCVFQKKSISTPPNLEVQQEGDSFCRSIHPQDLLTRASSSLVLLSSGTTQLGILPVWVMSTGFGLFYFYHRLTSTKYEYPTYSKQDHGLTHLLLVYFSSVLVFLLLVHHEECITTHNTSFFASSPSYIIKKNEWRMTLSCCARLARASVSASTLK